MKFRAYFQLVPSVRASKHTIVILLQVNKLNVSTNFVSKVTNLRAISSWKVMKKLSPWRNSRILTHTAILSATRLVPCSRENMAGRWWPSQQKECQCFLGHSKSLQRDLSRGKCKAAKIQTENTEKTENTNPAVLKQNNFKSLINRRFLIIHTHLSIIVLNCLALPLNTLHQCLQTFQPMGHINNQTAVMETKF